MFFRVSTLILAFVASVIASPGGVTINQCNNGQMQCCDNLMPASDASQMLGLSGLEGMIGINCNNILPIVGGGVSCSAQAVCCTGTKTDGLQLVGMNCSPMNSNL